MPGRESPFLALRPAWLVAVGSLASLIVAPESAQAFCRTTTQAFDASADDPSNSGMCWLEGMPIAWPSGRVPYGVASVGSKYFSAEQVTPVADLAFAAWNDAECIGGPPRVQAYDVGMLPLVDAGDCNSSASCDPATHDIISFDDDAWPYTSPFATLALTTVTYGTMDGVIFEAHTEVNTSVVNGAGQSVFSLSEPPPADGYDLQAILTHEAGHFLGLAHSTDKSAVMWAYRAPGVPGGVELTSDDQAGICAAYAPGPPAGCSCDMGPSSGAPAGCIVAISLASGAMIRRRSKCARRV